MGKKKIAAACGVGAAAIVFGGLIMYKNFDAIFPEKIDSDFTVSYDGIETDSIKAFASVHDPSIIKADGLFYIFGTHMTAAFSEDLRNPYLKVFYLRFVQS